MFDKLIISAFINAVVLELQVSDDQRDANVVGTLIGVVDVLGGEPVVLQVRIELERALVEQIDGLGLGAVGEYLLSYYGYKVLVRGMLDHAAQIEYLVECEPVLDDAVLVEGDGRRVRQRRRHVHGQRGHQLRHVPLHDERTRHAMH